MFNIHVEGRAQRSSLGKHVPPSSNTGRAVLKHASNVEDLAMKEEKLRKTVARQRRHFALCNRKIRRLAERENRQDMPHLPKTSC